MPMQPGQYGPGLPLGHNQHSFAGQPIHFQGGGGPGGGDSKSEVVTGTPPTASVTSSSPATATTAVTLDGSASTDPDGTIIGYRWELISGPATGTFSAPNGATTTFTPDV